MKKLIIAIYALLVCLSSAAQQQNARLDSLLNYYQQQFDYNGVAYVVQKGNVLLSKGYGYRDHEHKIKHDPKSVFQMGSVTKQFTAQIVLKLAEAGKISLEDKLNKFIPAYPNGNKITIKNLLTHTSGIYNYTEDRKWLDSEGHIEHLTIINSFKDSALAFEPGAKFEYSNSNYYLLGYIIEQVTGKSYETVAREFLLKPAGMTHSGFDFARLKSANKSVGYYVSGNNGLQKAPISDSTISWSAGGLYSTAEDMYKWHKSLQQYKFVNKNWQEKAYTPFKSKYGFGWFVDSLDKLRVLGHSGGIPGFESYIMRVEEQDLCIILITNHMGGVTNQNKMAVNIVNALYGKEFKMPVVSKEISLDAATLKKYVGEYVLDPTFSINITVKNNCLYAQGSGQPDLQIFPESEHLFYAKVVDAKLEFINGDDGKIAKIILHQNGHSIPGLKK